EPLMALGSFPRDDAESEQERAARRWLMIHGRVELDEPKVAPRSCKFEGPAHACVRLDVAHAAGEIGVRLEASGAATDAGRASLGEGTFGLSCEGAICGPEGLSFSISIAIARVSAAQLTRAHAGVTGVHRFGDVEGAEDPDRQIRFMRSPPLVQEPEVEGDGERFDTAAGGRSERN